MPTILEVINLSTKYLREKGIDSPRMNAELLLAHTLKMPRLQLYLSYELPLKEEELKIMRNYLKKRGEFEPLQYIIGETDFFGLKFKTDKRALVPRPETELLVEEIIRQYKDFEKVKFLEIGTGSGNIVISIVKNILNSFAVTIDKSSDAINLAKENAALNEVLNKIEFINCDLNQFEIKEEFDFVVSNPPYVSLNDYNSLQKEIVKYEPFEAVCDGNDGFSFYRMITEKAKKNIKHGGKIFFEIGFNQSEVVKSILEANDFKEISVIKDYQKIERIINGKKL